MGNIVKSKQSCPDEIDCGSSDAYHVYDDGFGHCFSCGKNFKDGNALDNSTGAQVSNATSDFDPLYVEPVSLSKRGIDSITSAFFGYGKGELSDGTIVQVANYYSKGKLVGQHTRDKSKDFLWLGNKNKVELFGQHKWRGGTGNKYASRLFITEGEIDCMSLHQVMRGRWSVVSIPSGTKDAVKSIAKNIDFVESFDEVVIAFDNDESGQTATREVCEILSPNKAFILSLPDDVNDINDMLKDNRVAELNKMLWQPSKWKPDGVYSLEEMEEEFFNQPPIDAIPYPENMPKLNEMLDRNRKGILNMWTAGSGVGKSTVVQSLAESIEVAEGRSLGVIALEESKNFTLMRYVAMEMNLPIKTVRELLESDEGHRKVREAYGRLKSRGKIHLYDHFGSKEVSSILSTIRYLIVGCGCSDIILDHISIVVSGLSGEAKVDERQLIDKLMTELRTMVEQYDCSIHAIVHLKRPENGKCWTRGREVALTALRGSGSLEQLSDTVIGVERDLQGKNPNLLQLRILKNRPNGVTGIADVLEYSPADGRLHARPEYSSIADAEESDEGRMFNDETNSPLEDEELDF